MATISPLARQLTPWLALFALTLLISLVMAPFLAPLAWASVLAYASWPLTEWLRTACRGRETLAAGVATALAASILIAPLLWLAWLGQQEVGRLYSALQGYIAAPPSLPARKSMIEPGPYVVTTWERRMSPSLLCGMLDSCSFPSLPAARA